MTISWYLASGIGMPYAGGGPAAQAVAANQVQITKFGIGNFLGLVRAGTVRAIAVSSEKRTPLLPEVPTLEESGLGSYPGKGWWGLLAPNGTLAAVVAKLNAEFTKLFTEPEFVAYLDQQAAVAAPTSSEEFARSLVEDRKSAEALVKIANTKRQEYKAE